MADITFDLLLLKLFERIFADWKQNSPNLH